MIIFKHKIVKMQIDRYSLQFENCYSRLDNLARVVAKNNKLIAHITLHRMKS